MREYCRELEILTIYHISTHSCLTKTNTKKCRHQVREAFLRYSGIGAHAIQQAEVGEAVVVGDIQEAHKRAIQLYYANIRYEKANLACERNPDKH